MGREETWAPLGRGSGGGKQCRGQSRKGQTVKPAVDQNQIYLLTSPGSIFHWQKNHPTSVISNWQGGLYDKALITPTVIDSPTPKPFELHLSRSFPHTPTLLTIADQKLVAFTQASNYLKRMLYFGLWFLFKKFLPHLQFICHSTLSLIFLHPSSFSFLPSLPPSLLLPLSFSLPPRTNHLRDQSSL